MKLKLFIISAIFLKFEECMGASLGPMSGTIGSIEVYKLGICPFKDTLKNKPYLELIKQGNTKMVNGNSTLNSEINAKTTYKLLIHKWTGTEYKKNVLKLNGPMCEQGKKFADKLFKNFYKSLIPKVSDNCIVKKGFYKFLKFQAASKDVSIPSLFYGKLKAEFHIYNGKDEIGCIEGEGETRP